MSNNWDPEQKKMIPRINLFYRKTQFIRNLNNHVNKIKITPTNNNYYNNNHYISYNKHVHYSSSSMSGLNNVPMTEKTKQTKWGSGGPLRPPLRRGGARFARTTAPLNSKCQAGAARSWVRGGVTIPARLGVLARGGLRGTRGPL